MHTFGMFGLVSFGFFILFVAATGIALAGGPQTTCLVMGGPMKRDLHADYKGERVYSCCTASTPEFGNDPQQYVNKMKAKGQDLEKIDSTK